MHRLRTYPTAARRARPLLALVFAAACVAAATPAVAPPALKIDLNAFDAMKKTIALPNGEVLAYIDTGKIRYVFHEFPLDPVAAASSVLSRCIAKGDSEKYFAVTDLLFRQQWAKVTKPRETLNLVGKQAGLDEQQVGACLQDEVLFKKIVAERIFATAKLGINATPTFLINGDKIVGETPFEEFDRRIKALLKS